MLGSDSGLQLHDPESGKAIGQVLGYPRQLESDTALAFSKDGKLLAAAGSTGEVYLWSALTGQPIGEPVMYGAAMTRIAFLPDGELLGVKVSDGTARTYRLNAPEPTPLSGENEVTILALNRYGHVLTHTASNHVIQWFDPLSGRGVSPAWENTNASVPVSSALSVDGKTLALAFPTQKEGAAIIRFHDAATGEVKAPAMPWESSGPLAFSADGKVLGGVSHSGGSVQMWNVTNGEVIAQIPFPKPNIVSWRHIEFSPEGKYAATQSGAGIFGTWHVWDLAARKLSPESYFAISPDWKRGLASTGLVDLSDPRQPQPASVSIPAEALQSLTLAKFSPDSRLLAVASDQGSVRLWDVSTGKPRAQVNVGGNIREMAFSENGHILLTAQPTGIPGVAWLGNLRLWDTASGVPCGLGITTTTNHVWNLWLDPKLRFVGVSLIRPVKKASGARMEIWKLPSLELPLAEMQQRTWLKVGRRLDVYGNLETIPAAEWNQLEASSHD